MLHNSNKEKAVKLDMNLKNHFAGDVCAAVKSREVGKDRAGGRAGDTSAAATNFGPPICSRQKHASERGETQDERSDYNRRGSLTWRAVHFDMTEENTEESTSPSRQKRTNSLHPLESS